MRYTVSTRVFDTLKEAEEQIRLWDEEGDLRAGTRVYETTGITYVPVIKLVKEKNAL